jgi:hypothetical protein
MRWLRVAAVVGVMLVGAGCANAVDGVAVAPPGTHPTANVTLADDGFGIQLGRSAAQVALEIYVEPQCPHCARFMMFDGGEIADYVDSGDLQVTYRPVTFLDKSATGYSHRVSNALFLAAAPDADLSAAEMQNFINELYWQADPSRDDQYLPASPKWRGCHSRWSTGSAHTIPRSTPSRWTTQTRSDSTTFSGSLRPPRCMTWTPTRSSTPPATTG